MTWEVEYTDLFGEWWTQLDRIQHRGTPYRVLYAFDPRRVAILLLGGTKKGDALWYDKMVPLADRLYDELLQKLETEDPPNG